MSAENVSGIKLCQSKLAENYFGHILCRQKICLAHIGQITTLISSNTLQNCFRAVQLQS